MPCGRFLFRIHLCMNAVRLQRNLEISAKFFRFFERFRASRTRQSKKKSARFNEHFAVFFHLGLTTLSRSWWCISISWLPSWYHSSLDRSVVVWFYLFRRKNDITLTDIFLLEGNICTFGLLVRKWLGIFLDLVLASSGMTITSPTHMQRMLAQWHHLASSHFIIINYHIMIV